MKNFLVWILKNDIVKVLKDILLKYIELDLEKCRRQYYYGCSAMRNKKESVASNIKWEKTKSYVMKPRMN